MLSRGYFACTDIYTNTNTAPVSMVEFKRVYLPCKDRFYGTLDRLLVCRQRNKTNLSYRTSGVKEANQCLYAPLYTEIRSLAN